MALRARRADDTRGQSAVEMALLTPVLLLLLVGITDFGIAIYAYNGASAAAREAAKFGANGGTDADTTTVFSNSFNVVNHSDNSYTKVWLIRFTTDGGGNILTSGAGAWTVTQTINGGGGGTALTRAQVQAFLNSAGGAGNAANLKFVITQVYYEHPTLFGWFGPRIGLSTFSMYRDVTP